MHSDALDPLADDDRQASAARLAAFLREASALRVAAGAEPQRAARQQRLRAFQAARLAATHADLLENARYRQAAEFFLSDLYAAKDVSARDAEIERVLPLMTRVLPTSGLQALMLAAELDALSERLDARMVDALAERLDTELTPETYAAAYRQVGEGAVRARQIALIGATGEVLDRLAHKPGLRTLLGTMRGPARVAGLGALQHFLERGFDAFRSMRRADEFLAQVTEREERLSRQWFGGLATPAPPAAG